MPKSEYVNDSLYHHYNGVSIYSSVISDKLRELSIFFDLEATDHFIYAIEHLIGVRDLLAIKYFEVPNQNLKGNEKIVKKHDYTSLIENTKSLGMGYAYNRCIDIDKTSRLPSILKQLLFTKAAILDNNCAQYDEIPQLEFSVEQSELKGEVILKRDVSIKEKKSKLINYDVIGTNPSLVFELNEPMTRSTFTKLLVHGCSTDRFVVYYSEDGTFNETDRIIYTPVEDGVWLNVGLLSDKLIKYLRIDAGKIGDKITISLPINIQLIFNEDELNNDPWRLLNDNTMQITHFSDNLIRGDIHVGQPRLIFFSIPWDDGWTIYDNGVKIDKIPMNIAFFGAYLTPGDHEIELRYITPGLILGAVVSCISLVIFIAWQYFNYKQVQESKHVKTN